MMFLPKTITHILRKTAYAPDKLFKNGFFINCTCLNNPQGHKLSTDTNQKNNSHLIIRGSFEDISDKTRSTYLDMVKLFETQNVHRRNHVEFIYAALKSMESFGVHRDVEVYKALMDVLPKGKFIPRNIFQAEFMHYPKQQQVIIDLLEQMEDNGKSVPSVILQR